MVKENIGCKSSNSLELQLDIGRSCLFSRTGNILVSYSNIGAHRSFAALKVSKETSE